MFFFHFFYKKAQKYKDSIECRIAYPIHLSRPYLQNFKKKARGYRSIDNGFVNSDLKFFIVMDGTGSIIGWELTETTKHDELHIAIISKLHAIFFIRTSTQV